MLRKIRKMLKQEEGFTLMELMIAVVIIGILGGIAIPVYKGVQERAKYAVGEANAQMLNRSIVHWIALGMPDENGQPQDKLIKEDEYDHEEHGAGLFAWLGLDEVEYVNWSKGDDEDDDDPRPDDYSPWQYYPDTSVEEGKLKKPEKPGPEQP